MSSISESKLQVYAELLPNILQIRLFVVVPDSSNATSTSLTSDGSPSELSLDLTNSRSSITISYHNEHLSLQLPVPVSEKSRECLKSREVSAVTPNDCSNLREKEYSFRLPIDETSASIARAAFHEHQGTQVPWTARDMASHSRIRCQQCSNIFLIPQRSNGFVWKDLPSADWAEMMDLWHCHKPDTHEDDKDANGDNNEIVKGYGAGNRLTCSPGTIFVNVSSFIIAEDDCRGLKKVTKPSTPDNRQRLSNDASQASSSQPQPSVILRCESCDTVIGEEHTSLQGLELFKPTVSVLRQQQNAPTDAKLESDSWESSSAEIIVSSQLLELVERTGARRFAVHADNVNAEGSKGLLLWVFNPEIRYSCNISSQSISRTASAQRALKIFYQNVLNVSSLVNPEPGMPSSASLEELCLPQNSYDEMKTALESSSKLLPSSARKFREWNVGLLNSFEHTS